jgi:restriction endonuclease S subunit
MEDWAIVEFGDVIHRVKTKFNSNESELERYVAGRHIDAGDLTIRRAGYLKEEYVGPAFNTVFTSGQVLYGSRRTYLRKLAIADFDGVCSNTTLILESSKPELLLPKFLPILMSSENFHKYSELHSKGSVTPYINFSDLAKYKFKLPPIKEQQKSIACFYAISSLIDKLLTVAEDSSLAMKIMLKMLMKNMDHGKICDIFSISSGESLSRKEVMEISNIDYPNPVYGANGIIGFTKRSNNVANTIIVGRVGAPGEVHITNQDCWISDNALIFHPLVEQLDVFFCENVLEILHLGRYKIQSVQPLITKSGINNVLFPIPSMQEKNEFNKVALNFHSVINSANGEISKLQSLRTSLANISTGVPRGNQDNIEVLE